MFKKGRQNEVLKKETKTFILKKTSAKRKDENTIFPKRGETFFFNEKFLACEMDREKHFLVFS